MAWNEAMKAWASAGPKKAARRKGGRLVQYTVTEHYGAWKISREVLVTKRGARLIETAIRLAEQLRA